MDRMNTNKPSSLSHDLGEKCNASVAKSCSSEAENRLPYGAITLMALADIVSRFEDLDNFATSRLAPVVRLDTEKESPNPTANLDLPPYFNEVTFQIRKLNIVADRMFGLLDRVEV